MLPDREIREGTVSPALSLAKAGYQPPSPALCRAFPSLPIHHLKNSLQSLVLLTSSALHWQQPVLPHPLHQRSAGAQVVPWLQTHGGSDGVNSWGEERRGNFSVTILLQEWVDSSWPQLSNEQGAAEARGDSVLMWDLKLRLVFQVAASCCCRYLCLLEVFSLWRCICDTAAHQSRHLPLSEWTYWKFSSTKHLLNWTFILLTL